MRRLDATAAIALYVRTPLGATGRSSEDRHEESPVQAGEPTSRENLDRKGVSMIRRVQRTFLRSVACLVILFGWLSADTKALNLGFSTLTVNAEAVTIFRDELGVPHIFAQTNRGLFEAYGFTVAEDRLWQLELNRRAARGRLAEVLGPSFVGADRLVRMTGYTDAELDAQFARLSGEEQEIFAAYRDGINRYIAEVVARDPLSKLPFEFHALRIFPEPWTLRDSLAFGVFMVRQFGEIGGRELKNQALLLELIDRHGAADGYAIFNDVRWTNDPDAPVTVPSSEATDKRQTLGPVKAVNPAQLHGRFEGESSDPAKVRAQWESIGVPTKLGSYAWVVSAAKSAEGFALLYGGPQMGFNAPEVLHEVQLNGGNDFNVAGMAFAGLPAVLIGRNEHVAWTSTTGTGDNLDFYLEKRCDAGGGPKTGYQFDGTCLPFEVRVETINVRDAAAVSFTVLRSVHGPVVDDTRTDFAVSQKRGHWQREIETMETFFGFDRARNLHEFEAAVEQVVTSHNFLYADKRGNIAYWQAGQVPARPAGFDPRLPLPGDGSAEWPGGILAIPKSINPAQGFLANWNNKPSVNYDNADSLILGKQFRLWDITDRLASGRISLEDMRDIPKDIARIKSLGREARFLRPYLLAALDDTPPHDPIAPEARKVLEGWEGSAFADAVASTVLEPGEVIFSTWLSRMLANTFSDALGDKVAEASTNMLIHVLDFAFTGASGVAPSRDYFSGRSASEVMSITFDQAVAALAAAQGDNPAAWTGARGAIKFNHPIIGTVGSIPNSNRATYAQIIVLSHPKPRAENIFTLGQSGFIQLVPTSGFALDPHFKDQLELYRDFKYKTMRLFQNSKLHE